MRGFSRLFYIIIFIWFIACFGCIFGLQISRSALKKLLSPAEWITIVGNSDLDVDAHYSIVYPIYTAPEKTPEEKEKGAEHGSDITQKLTIPVPSLKKNLTLELVPSPYLMSDDVLLLESFNNASNPLSYLNHEIHCCYRGENSAVCLCNGVRGIIYSDDQQYIIIHPMPQRLQKEDKIAHILLHRRRQSISPNILDKRTCMHDSSHLIERYQVSKSLPDKSNVTLSNLVRRKRETFPMGTPVFVETAVFVDKDLFEHMKTNFPVDTERELIRFVLAMINAVQLLYHDPSLGRPVNFVLKRLEIMKEETPGLTRPPDIDRFLSNFCNWQRTKNPVGDREPQHWDHALILTGLDLYVRGKHGKISSQVVGLAPVAGMCTATSSCTVNEGRHFESVYVVAHEIGHNLGMRHDGPLADNDCDPTSYIMSPTLGSGKITWSPCSKRYLQKFLDTTQSRCLLDHGSSAGQLDHSAEGALPGERFDANQQCMLKYGKGSRHSMQQPLDDVCRDLHCERERYTWTSHPALEGTMCGHNMWCRGGRCISRGPAPSAVYSSSHLAEIRVDKVNGGWSKWRPFSDCASGCLFGQEGRLRSGSTGIMISTRTCNNPRPQGNGLSCDGPEKKYQACNAQQCLNVPKLTVKEFAEQICSRARDVDKDLTGSGVQKVSSDPEEACLVWCQKRNGGTKSRGWTYPDGTACQSNYNRYGRSSYCINGKCEEFSCGSYDETMYAQMPDLCPMEREDNEVTYRNGLYRQQDNRIKWKSASGCHYNCVSPGSGIRLVMSKGKISKSSIQLCQPDQYACSRIKSPFQHASTVCSKFKERVRRLSGLGMQISPVLEDPDRPCRVACQDENISHRFYLVNGEEGWFPFGTDCSRSVPDKKAYCISGKCLDFGSDDTPVSESEFTLPLLSRSKRSLENNKTKVTAKLDQKELEEIIKLLNRTISGNYTTEKKGQFDIDLNNPIHINMDTDTQYATGHSSENSFLNYT